VVFWILAFNGMTEGTGTHVRHAGERRHPGVIPRTQLINPKEYNSLELGCGKSIYLRMDQVQIAGHPVSATQVFENETGRGKPVCKQGKKTLSVIGASRNGRKHFQESP